MPRLNDSDRLHLRRFTALEVSKARHDGHGGVRIDLRGDDVALATTAMAQAVSIPERVEAARRLVAMWNLFRGVPTGELEQMARAETRSAQNAGMEDGPNAHPSTRSSE